VATLPGRAELRNPYIVEVNSPQLFGDSQNVDGHLGLENYSASYSGGYLHIYFTTTHGACCFASYPVELLVSDVDPRLGLSGGDVRYQGLSPNVNNWDPVNPPTDWYSVDIQFSGSAYTATVRARGGAIWHEQTTAIAGMSGSTWVALYNAYPVSGCSTDPDCVYSMAFTPMPLTSNAGIVPVYSLTDLGELPGGSDNSRAFAINNVGTVVGQSDGTADADYTGGCGGGSGGGRAGNPFIWTAAGGMQALGPTPTLDTTPPLTPCGGAALGTSDHGEVVGRLDYGFAGGFQSFIWTAGSGMQLIPGGGGLGGGATDINNTGQVVGRGGASAFRWTEIGGLESLEIPGGQVSHANAINSLASISTVPVIT